MCNSSSLRFVAGYAFASCFGWWGGKMGAVRSVGEWLISLFRVMLLGPGLDKSLVICFLLKIAESEARSVAFFPHSDGFPTLKPSTPLKFIENKNSKRSRTIFRFFFWSSAMGFFKSFLYAIFLKRFKHFDCDVGHEFGFQAEWEFLNGGRNWKFEELRVVSVWTERSSPWPMEGYTKYDTSAHAFFLRFHGCKRSRKGFI